MIFLVLMAVVGLCVGSFLTVVGHRMPQKMHHEWQCDVAEYLDDTITDDALQAPKTAIIAALTDKPTPHHQRRSHCPHCQTMIAWYDNIPIISYALLAGKCRHCRHAISKQYPIIELGCGLISVLVAVRFGISEQGVFALLFVWLLLALTIIDYRHQLLPDRLVLPLALLGGLVNAFSLFATPAQSLLGAVAGFGVLWSINAAYRLMAGRDGMGLGDAKLLAALGAWLGIAYLPLVLMIASILGVVAGFYHQRQGQRAFAFGPYLAAGGLFALCFGKQLMDWYWQLAF